MAIGHAHNVVSQTSDTSSGAAAAQNPTTVADGTAHAITAVAPAAVAATAAAAV